MAKHIFVTGGVVSSLGKGITAASLGTAAEGARLQGDHAEVRPLSQRGPRHHEPLSSTARCSSPRTARETDLDLGHYERFVDENLTRYSYRHLRSGLSSTSSSASARGGYHGGTVQVIPHITDEIKEKIYRVGEQTAPTSSSPRSAAPSATSRASPSSRPSASFKWEVAPERRAVHPRHAHPVSESVAGAKDQAHPALGKGAAGHGHTPRHARLPQRLSHPAGDARQALAVLQRRHRRRASARTPMRRIASIEVPHQPAASREKFADKVCEALAKLPTPRPARLQDCAALARPFPAPPGTPVRAIWTSPLVGKYVQPTATPTSPSVEALAARRHRAAAPA